MASVCLDYFSISRVTCSMSIAHLDNEHCSSWQATYHLDIDRMFLTFYKAEITPKIFSIALVLVWWLSPLERWTGFLDKREKSFLEFQFVATFVCWECLPSFLRGETRRREKKRKEASTFREQLFSHKLPFCPYKQKLSVLQKLKELSYLGSVQKRLLRSSIQTKMFISFLRPKDY